MSKKTFRDLIVYEIYPTSFFDGNNDGTGDLKGITSKLKYIKDTGFNAIWLNPFYVSPFRDGGYDVADFFDVDERFGTLRDFRNLCKKAHEKGIRIFVDLVAGHASMDNPDFLQSAKAERNEKSDLFIWNDNPWEKGDGLINGMFDRHGSYKVNFFAHQPAFNYGYKDIDQKWQMSYKDKRTFKAREYMLNVMRFWLKQGADGFRVDMADSLVKNDEDKSATIEVWKWMFKKIRKEFPDVFFVSEWSNPERSLEAGFDADFVLDHWDNFYHRFFRSDASTRGVSIMHGENDVEFALEDMKKRFEAAEEKKGYLSMISGNHDSWRIANYLSEKELHSFYLFLFTMPGIPFVLYGDEIAMKTADLPSKDGGYQRTGTRIPMVWDESLPSHGFSKASETYLPFYEENKQSVRSAIKDKNSLYHYIRRCIELRKQIKDLKGPHVQIKENDRVFFFDRGKYQLILNLSKKDYELNETVVFGCNEDENYLKTKEAVLVERRERK
ncbi:MAG: alpha-amylase family glycosyl hydrolase [Erysipelotrichaceae bacterium]|nr:alpha-amylase family glycosyl hydrolase [Erysipelotrichaceae bacterium]